VLEKIPQLAILQHNTLYRIHWLVKIGDYWKVQEDTYKLQMVKVKTVLRILLFVCHKDQHFYLITYQ
jgi:hypothetical protein